MSEASTAGTAPEKQDTGAGVRFEKRIGRRSTKIFRLALFIGAAALIILLAAMFLTLLARAFPAIGKFGAAFFYTKTWDPVKEEFGALPFIYVTVLTSFLALAISIPFSLAISLYLGEYYGRGVFSSILRSAVELLAGIPSVIYGFWGLFVLVPVIRQMEQALGVTPYGVGIFSAAIILAIMIIPYSASIGREVIAMVPDDLKEAAYSLGATKFEVIKKVIIPYARRGIFTGFLLALGRALGETMAVTMVIGNANMLPKPLFDIFDPGNTMASVIANEFTEAVGTVYLSSLIYLGLVLFLITMVINIIGKVLIKRFDRGIREDRTRR